MVCFSKEKEVQKSITEIKWYEGWNGEVYRNVYIKTAVAKFQAYLKINSNTTQTQMGKQK